MTTNTASTGVQPKRFNVVDQLAATIRYRDQLVKLLAGNELPNHKRQRSFRNLVATIELIRNWERLIQVPAEQEARALIAQQRQGTYD